MSQGAKCHVHTRAEFRRAHVRHNHSAFNGYHQTYSPYTEVVCIGDVNGMTCRHRWRSRAAWVDGLPLLKAGEIKEYPAEKGCE